MVDKKEPAKGWPVVKGEYDAGDPKSDVAVATCGSHFSMFPIKAGAAIAGPFKTENLGIEKIVANIISNPNIRFLIICGSEVKGHISGDALISLHKYGVKDGRIINAKGAIPFIENLDANAIKRFQEQVQLVEMVDVEDEAKITAAIKDAIAKDPGAFAGEPMLIQIKEKEEETLEAGAALKPLSGELAVVQARLRMIKNDVKDIGYMTKFTMGWYAGKMEGILIGIVICLLLLYLLFPTGINWTTLKL
jgi:tetrahydromethanopterin S-methyltransferase subunit A